MNEISLAKASLRKQILTNRKDLTYSADALTRNLLELVNQHSPKRVATYVSYPSEPRTTDFIQTLVNSSIPVVVPETLENGRLSWHEFIGREKTDLGSGDLLVIPALAVDRMGNRLGRGKGYFDRELAELAGVTIYAVVFENEFIEQVPVEPHDKRVDGVVTQEGIHKIK